MSEAAAEEYERALQQARSRLRGYKSFLTRMLEGMTPEQREEFWRKQAEAEEACGGILCGDPAEFRGGRWVKPTSF